MEKFNFRYDSESDDLFIYLEGKKSSGAIELGNFVLDFEDNGNLVALEIINFSEILSKFFSKIKDASEIKNIETEIVNFRNMEWIKFSVSTSNEKETANILIPHIKEKSPVLRY